MKISIKNFQCHTNVVLELTLGEHCLIAGESGRGKSTVFRAINWCLYGEGKDIAPSTNMNATTSVEIEMAGLKIYRQHNPCLLRILCDGMIYEGEPAQSIIESRLGNSQIWNCTTYMPYNFENPLIGVQPKKRMEYLDTLSFTLEKPSVYLQNIDNEISLVKKKQETLDTNIKTRELMLNDYVRRHNLSHSEFLPLDQISSLETYIRERTSEIESKKELSVKMQVRLAQREILVCKLRQLQSDANLIPKVTPEIVRQKEDQYQQYETRTALVKRIQLLPKFETIPTPYTTEEIEKCRSLEYKREQMMKLSSSLGIEYSSEFGKYKQYWIDMLDWLEYDKNLTLYRNLQHEISEIEKEIDIIKLDLKSQQYTLSTLEEKIEIPEIPTTPVIHNPPEYPNMVHLPKPEPPKTIVLVVPEKPKSIVFDVPERPVPKILEKPLVPTHREIILPEKPESIVLDRPVAPLEIDTKEIYREMHLLLLGKQLLHCPSCAVALRLTEGNLQIAANAPEWDPERYLELQSKISTYEESLIRHKVELEEINLKEKRLNTEAMSNWKREVDLVQDTERRRFQEATRQYEIEIQRIKSEEQRQNSLLEKEYKTLVDGIKSEEQKQNSQLEKEYKTLVDGIKSEEHRQNSLLKKEYQTLVSVILQREASENAAIFSKYNQEKTKYDEMMRYTQEMYQSKLVARERARHQEEERLHKQRMVLERIEFDRKKLVERESSLYTRKSQLVDPGPLRERPSLDICDVLGKRDVIESTEILQEKIRKIVDLEWIEPINVNSAEMLKNKSLCKIYAHKLALESDLEKLIDVDIITLEEVEKLKEQLQRYLLLSSEISKLESELMQIPDCTQEYYILESSIKSLAFDLNNLKSKLNRARLCTDADDMYRIVDNLKSDYRKSIDDMAKHQYFREIMVKLEYQYYDDLTSEINKYLNVHTSYLFESDIRIRLSLTKPLKNGKFKKEVNLDITREGVHVSYPSLSDGERARVNLLLTCALNQLSTNNLLILDETLSCLDAENKHKCMEFISEHLTGTTLLMVNHEANPGDYTRKIDI